MSMMDSKDWIKKGREKAPELRESAKAAVAEMFATGDLSGFLNVLSRLPVMTPATLFSSFCSTRKLPALRAIGSGSALWQTLAPPY